MASEPYTYVLDSETGLFLKLYLFRDVKNVDEIKSEVVKGSLQCAVVRAALVLDPLQVAVAANRAALQAARNALVTRSIYTEIIYNLSISKNISQSLNTFGVGADTDLLVCVLVRDSEEPPDVKSLVLGSMVPLSELNKISNIKQIKEIYKVKSLETVAHDRLLQIIVSRIVTKTFV